jgi:hypothetical protein
MNVRCVRRGGILLAALALASWAASGQAPERPARYRPTDDERLEIRRRVDSFSEALAKLESEPASEVARSPESLADVRIFLKAAEWILAEEEFFAKGYVEMTLGVLEAGQARLASLEEGKTPWASAKGGSIRGFVSVVDGSVQPYAVYVPESYDGSQATRLDVILHGRAATLNEVKFVRDHDGKPYPDGESGLILHVFGRGNNAYRWAGETDVFEAIRSVSRRYRVDPTRVVLRGFSMGGAGAWHLGLHHPREWCAVEAGAGFTESRNYARLGEIPEYQARALHVYDAVDYALNAFDVPIAGYGGEEDKQLQASVNVREALRTLGFEMKTDGLVTRGEGIDFLQVVGAKTGHKVDPASEAILRAFRDEHAGRGQDLRPEKVRFATYTLAYNQAPWLTVEGLRSHYERAVVEAEVADDEVVVGRADNVTVLAINRDMGENVRLGEQRFPLRGAVGGALPDVYYRRSDEGWAMLDYDQSRALQLNALRAKRPHLQGPIDHAFAGPFLCVRGTRRAWNPNVKAWSDARLERFADEWRTYLRGEIRIKDDVDVTPEDIQRYHLVLFGDPGSNVLIERVLPELSVRWTKIEVAFGDAPGHAAADHVPALIAASPLNPLRYVVLNSGHTFGAEEFEGTNALLYPRLGDFAVLRVKNRGEEAVESGYFDEGWKLPPAAAKVSPPGR